MDERKLCVKGCSQLAVSTQWSTLSDRNVFKLIQGRKLLKSGTSNATVGIVSGRGGALSSSSHRKHNLEEFVRGQADQLFFALVLNKDTIHGK